MFDFSVIILKEDLRYQVVLTPVSIFLHKLVCLLASIWIVDVIEHAGDSKFLCFLSYWLYCCWYAVRAPLGVDNMNGFEAFHVLKLAGG